MATDPAAGAALSPPAGSFRSIQTRLAALFCVVFAAVIIVIELLDFFGIPFFPYSGRWGQAKLEAIKDVDLIADLKAERLRAWVADARKDLRVLATNATRAEQTARLQRSIAEFEKQGLHGEALWSRVRQQSEYVELAGRLREIEEAYPEYLRVFLVASPSGTIIASSSDADLGADVHHYAFARQPTREGDDYVGDVIKVAAHGDPVFHISRPVRAGKRSVGAVLVAEVRAEDLLPPMLHAGEEMRTTEDAVLVNREGIILTPLKSPLADGTMPKPLEYRITAEPAQRAAHGEEGIVESNDYRGAPVLAATRFIRITPELGWGLVVKRERREILADLQAAAVRHVLVAMIGILVVVILSFMVARSVTGPLRALAETAGRVAGGDLSARAPVITQDEVGALATTFNAMLARIRDAQQALLRQERLAALGQLTATVSHEIRNPLGTIRTSAFILRQRLRGKGLEVEPSLERIERSIARCDAIIAELLDYSRARPLQPQATCVDQWLAGLLDEHDFPPGVSVSRELAAGVTVPVDQERLRRCLVNLLSNACQAMEPEGGRLTVATGCRDGRLHVRVSDTGCGIPPELLHKIFEPLYSTKTFGVGLGLAIVQQIAAQHGAGVEVESQPGRGTTFTVWLPLPGGPTAVPQT